VLLTGSTAFTIKVTSYQPIFQWLFQPIQGPGLLFSSVIIFTQTVGLLRRVISPLQGRYLNTGQHKHRINAYTHQTTMPWVGFEPTIQASERAKTVHDLDRAATVISALKPIITCRIYYDRTRRYDYSLKLLDRFLWNVFLKQPHIMKTTGISSNMYLSLISTASI
jgi:hypothetical protein